MSEYQYYEWLAIDRPLDDRQLSEVARLSSHMDTVTPACAIVTYSFGDFKPHGVAQSQARSSIVWRIDWNEAPEFEHD